MVLRIQLLPCRTLTATPVLKAVISALDRNARPTAKTLPFSSRTMTSSFAWISGSGLTMCAAKTSPPSATNFEISCRTVTKHWAEGPFFAMFWAAVTLRDNKPSVGRRVAIRSPFKLM